MATYPDCSAALTALAAGLDDQTCHDFRAIREVVMCDAWHGGGAIAPVTPGSFRQRVDDAWARVRGACALHGGTTPEAGFLQPGDVAVHVSLSPLEVYEIRRGGAHEGLLVLQPDGGVSACLADGCRDVGHGPGAIDSLRTLLELQGYEVMRE